MQIAVVEKSITEVEAGAVLLGLFEGEKELRGSLGAVDEATGGAVRALMENGDLTGKLNETAVFYPSGALPAKRLVFVGLGKASDLTLDRCRQAGGTAARRAHKQRAKCIAAEVLGIRDDGPIPLREGAQATLEGILLGSYQAKNFKTDSKENHPLTETAVLVPPGGKKEAVEGGVQTGQIFADAVWAARDLVNQPANHMTPAMLADVARAIACKDGLACEVMEEDRIAELGMGAFLGVAKGSKEPPRFIVLEHRGAASGEKTATVVLVGKGITFDSGGISLKPRDHMEDMKSDMAGAAAVICAMQGAARLDLPLHVVALAPACENLPSSGACKPGDVLTAMNGKSIEVINTDAEGRLILADALCYADRYQPDAVVDVATLTGACVVALGEEVAAGLFASDEKLKDELIRAGEFNGEKLWPFPLYDEYKEKIKSEVADMKNAGGRFGGVGTSAVFLKEFVSYPWAHLDIAGMALAKSDLPYIPKGGTGFAVRTLLKFLMHFRKSEK